ncbi:imidazole glycerol phosphate synthase subunit HisF [Curvivirga aplysinae]|uniref:imidazole glycerol phosphate synthase subunit HisF n=1 Tax=Curvivirga aplysinae TaxID=2529852 RepID=UPI0012BBC967|nr:imidazole glycerol phosphate synthase subunit HisF [Curvivirga aplysinae]MTI11396.1 imidazole glycerol phosphate synthase subunit HisF [Curvivirga aplysinae]
MSRPRVIARLDIKGPNLIKGVHLEGVRVVGDPNEYALQYYEEGADELLYIDAVASLYGRNNLTEVVHHTTKNIFIPLTVGGGIRSVKDVELLLKSGADKVAINTAAVQNESIISEVSRAFGNQCTVIQIDAKKKNDKTWEVYVDGGREKTGIDVLEWAQTACELGAGEILLTSIDQEGTRRGMDIELIDAVAKMVNIPVIASGGVGKIKHIKEAFINASADAVAVADLLHFKRAKLSEIHPYLISEGIQTRKVLGK